MTAFLYIIFLTDFSRFSKFFLSAFFFLDFSLSLFRTAAGVEGHERRGGGDDAREGLLARVQLSGVGGSAAAGGRRAPGGHGRQVRRLAERLLARRESCIRPVSVA